MKFCPQCAGSLVMGPVPGDTKERLVCQSCRFVYYLDPKVSACTIPVLEGKIVLAQRAIEPGRGKWVFPGGYMDRGETVTEAAARETLEEVGLQVRVTDLIGAYSYHTSIVVVLVYACEVIGGELRVDHESEAVGLFAPHEIPWDQLAFPSTRDALRAFLAGPHGARLGR